MQGIGFVGNLTKPPAVTALSGGRTVSRFTLAVDDGFRNNAGEWHKRPTLFVSVECWKDAEASTNWQKGSPVLVVGQWRAEEYEKDGEKRRRQFLAADAAAALDRPRRAGEDPQADRQAAPDAAAPATAAAGGEGVPGLDPDDPYAVAR